MMRSLTDIASDIQNITKSIKEASAHQLEEEVQLLLHELDALRKEYNEVV
jgi:hypothetical protein